MNRRDFFGALVALPIVAKAAVAAPRCDADYIEGEWNAGRPVIGGKYVVRRPLRMAAKGATLHRAHVTFAGAWDMGLVVTGEWVRITENVFTAEPA